MASDTRVSESAVDDRPRLRQGSIGTAGIIFMVVAATAPVTAVSTNLSLSIAIGAGQGTLGLLFVVAGVFALFTAGYVAMSRHVVSAGAFYEYIAYGLGRSAGSGFACIATVLYGIGTAVMALASGFFAQLTANELGFYLPWWLFALGTLLVAGICGQRGVRTATRVTSVTSCIQFAILFAFSFAVLVRNPGGYDATGFTPSAMFQGSFSLSLIVLVLCFAGYESAAVYGEEARSAHRSIKRATYGSLGALLLIFFVSCWSLLAAYEDPVESAQEEPAMLLFAAADQYLGAWAGPFLVILATFSFVSATISLNMLAQRYIFALGRAGIFPRVLARVHVQRGTPHVANWVLVTLVACLLTVFAIEGSDPFLVVIPTLAGIVGLSLLLLLMTCSVSVVAARISGRLPGTRWSTLTAPSMSAVAWMIFVILFLLNFETVTESSSLFVRGIAIAVPVTAFIFGYAAHSKQLRQGREVNLSGGSN